MMVQPKGMMYRRDGHPNAAEMTTGMFSFQPEKNDISRARLILFIGSIPILESKKS